jgi:hypothetical protein|tara:strand:+ start:9407 stop:9622 length:216 start_codon:yes stop_codon:yes gene_type:complete
MGVIVNTLCVGTPVTKILNMLGIATQDSAMFKKGIGTMTNPGGAGIGIITLHQSAKAILIEHMYVLINIIV